MWDCYLCGKDVSPAEVHRAGPDLSRRFCPDCWDLQDDYYVGAES